jgi:hypothetical protein
MKNKIVGIYICMLLITTGVLPIVSSETKTVCSSIETKSSSENLMNGGWYEVKSNITVLHVNGSYYQMGYQHGFLMKERILQFYRAFLSWFESYNFSYERLLTIWNSTSYRIPECYIDEMHGIADGANISFEDVAVANIESLVLNYVTTGVAGGNTSTPDSCTSVVAWGPATRDGRLYHFRSCDFDSTVKDPETGISAIDTGVLIVRTPADAYASVSPEWPGWVCTGNGINEHEISIGETTCVTTEFTFDGIGYYFRIRMALDTADTAEDAINILSSNRTEGCTIIVSDGNIPTAYVLEQTANQSYVGSWDNEIESKWPFWEIDHVIRRVNFYVNPNCAKTQQGMILNPRFSTLLYILTIILGNTGIGQSFDWLRYKATSKGMMNEKGNLDLNTTMQQMRDVYNFKNNFLWGVIGKKWDYQYPVGVGWQWVACPETGDFLLSMSHNNTSAYQMPTTLFNINDLINATPP